MRAVQVADLFRSELGRPPVEAWGVQPTSTPRTPRTAHSAPRPATPSTPLKEGEVDIAKWRHNKEYTTFLSGSAWSSGAVAVKQYFDSHPSVSKDDKAVLQARRVAVGIRDEHITMKKIKHAMTRRAGRMRARSSVQVKQLADAQRVLTREEEKRCAARKATMRHLLWYQQRGSRHLIYFDKGSLPLSAECLGAVLAVLAGGIAGSSKCVQRLLLRAAVVSAVALLVVSTGRRHCPRLKPKDHLRHGVRWARANAYTMQPLPEGALKPRPVPPPHPEPRPRCRTAHTLMCEMAAFPPSSIRNVRAAMPVTFFGFLRSHRRSFDA
eukprot:Sspe_Gene.86403::Locus_57078_Transcript_2_2_Confidence_0.750_Length_1205::g.86403::m.86403